MRAGDRVGAVVLLAALAGCSASHAETPPQPVTHAQSWVAQVNERCVDFDRRKTAFYYAALIDGTLTVPEYCKVEAAVAPIAGRFDAQIARLTAPADEPAQQAYRDYRSWVTVRRQSLDRAAATGSEKAFAAALDASNTAFPQAPQVRQMKAEGFVLACLSR